MSEEGKQEAFLERWSRLKRRQADEAAKPAPVEEKKAEATPAPLPPVAELKPDSDFTPFMDPRVDAATRRTALKTLFTDAHFNVPDPFEPYSVDLTVAESIPEEMLKSLNHAKRLLFDEKQQAAEAPAQSSPQPQVQATEPKDVAGKQDA